MTAEGGNGGYDGGGTATPEDPADEGSTDCEWCGEPFDRQQWHYPGVEYADGGEVLVRLFCSEQCRARWEYRTGPRRQETDGDA